MNWIWQNFIAIGMWLACIIVLVGILIEDFNVPRRTEGTISHD